MSRRDLLMVGGLVAAGWAVFPAAPPAHSEPIAVAEIEVVPLSYGYDELEPAIDRNTMILHHDKHYAAYTKKLNEALEKLSGKVSLSVASFQGLSRLLTSLDQIEDSGLRSQVRNNGGGYINHTFFFDSLCPPAQAAKKSEPTGKLAEMITQSFGTFSAFQDTFERAALSQFGSGWAWLYVDANGQLAVKGYPNQDTPLMEGFKPVLGFDIWEHAYYLKYNNRRPDYVRALWSIINWDTVESRV